MYRKCGASFFVVVNHLWENKPEVAYEKRLFQILYLLIEKGSMTAPELANLFEVSTRTIYRDIDQLSQAGVPIYTNQGSGGGIFIQENFVLKKALLTDLEQKQLLTSVESLSAVLPAEAMTLLPKLVSLFANQQQEATWLEVDFSDWGRQSKENFLNLQQALQAKVNVCFSYPSKSTEQQRKVNPLKLVFKHRDWYLYGYCLQRQAFRFFKLTRMKNLKVTEEVFIRETPPKIFREDSFALPKKEVVLRFDQELQSEVYENFEAVKVVENGLLVTEHFPVSEYFYRFLLSFGSQVEVLSPLEIREEIQRRAKKLLENYQT